MGFIGMRLTFTGRPRRSFASLLASTASSFLPATSVYSIVMRRRARERIRAQRVHELGERVLLVDGHQARARLVVGRVERDGEADLAAEVLAEPRDLRDEAARRDRDPPRREADAVRCVRSRSERAVAS